MLNHFTKTRKCIMNPRHDETAVNANKVLAKNEIKSQSIFPQEILGEMCHYMNLPSLTNFGKTCQFFKAATIPTFNKYLTALKKAVVCGDRFTIFTTVSGKHFFSGHSNSQTQFPYQWKGKAINLQEIIINNITEIVAAPEGAIFIDKKNGKSYGSGTLTIRYATPYLTSSYSKTNEIKFTDINQIATSGFHIICLQNNGDVNVLGKNDSGQLGLGKDNNTDQRSITKLNISNVSKVFCRNSYSFFLKKDNTVWACGNNAMNQLGLDETRENDFLTPMQVPIEDVEDIILGDYTTLFLKKDKTVWGCGNYFPSLTSIFTKLKINQVIQVVAGNNHFILLKENGTVETFGENEYGQLGLGNCVAQDNLIQITALAKEKIIAIYAGGSHSLFLNDQGILFGCGNNSSYQLGLDKSIKKQLTPVKLPIDLININTLDVENNNSKPSLPGK